MTSWKPPKLSFGHVPSRNNAIAPEIRTPIVCCGPALRHAPGAILFQAAGNVAHRSGVAPQIADNVEGAL